MLDELNKKYRGLKGEDLINQIRKDFGDKAANKLETDGYLSLNEAIGLRNEEMFEALGLYMKCNRYGRYGDIFGLIIEKEDPVFNFTTH